MHIFGYPADMPAFERLAGEHGLWLVEDACEALGAVHGDGRRRRRARAPGRLRVLPEQAGRDRRGRCGGLHRRRHEGADRQRAQPGPRARHGLARPRPARLQLPPLGRGVRARAGPARAARRAAVGEGARSRRLQRATRRHRGPRAPVRRRGRRPPVVVRLRGPAATGDRPRRGDRADASRRGRLEAIPAGDPPDELLPRALRPPRGGVPRVRGRVAAIACAAFLPGAHRSPGRNV